MKFENVKEIWVAVDTRNQVQRLDLFYENNEKYEIMKNGIDKKAFEENVAKNL